MTKETGGPAFPINVESEMTCLGMTLRDYFAAKAMQGILASFTSSQPDRAITAKASYQYADAMLKAREQ